MCNHLVFRYYPITCQFRKIKTLGSTEPAGIMGGELFGSVTVKASSDSSNLIFEMNVGKKRIRHTTTLKLNDEFLDQFNID